MEKQHAKILGLRVSAIVEIAIFMAILIVLNVIFDGNRFSEWAPHPCWFLVVLIAVQYGTAEGLLAVIASSLFLLFGNMPEQSLDQDMYAYMFEVAKRPILWTIVAVIAGEIRNRHIRERHRMEKELRAAHEREERISDSYEWVKNSKQRLESRVAGQLRSSIDTYNAAKSIEKLNPKDVISGVQELIGAVLNPEKFSIHMLNENGLEASVVSGWEHNEEFARFFESTAPLYREVIGNQQVLCVANDVQETVIAGQGVLAGPLIDTDSNQVIGMLKVEDMGFTDLDLSTVESFRSICEWVGMAFVNAEKYQAAKAESVINPEHNLMTNGYFHRYTDYISSLARRLNFDVSMIVVKVVDSKKMNNALRNTAARNLSDVVSGVLRSVDQAFDYQEDSGEYSIVLPATDTKGARVVMNKIEKGLANRGSDLSNVRFAFSVHSIHEK